MADHPNARIVERVWDALSRSDVDALRDEWGDDLIWHVQAGSPWAGEHVGTDAILDYLADVGESTDDYNLELDDIIANDNHVVVLTHMSAQRADRSLDTSFVVIARMKDERIVEVWTLPVNPAAVSEFWSAPDSSCYATSGPQLVR